MLSCIIVGDGLIVNSDAGSLLLATFTNGDGRPIMMLSRSEFITVRGMRHHVRHWGAATAPLLVMLHGWMDVSASFQFVVDELQKEWHVIAPDWRGFGLTDPTPADTYWFADYLGDLDAILTHFSPIQPVNLLGHSMGANVAMLYAGVRPHRIAKLINLEGFGMPASQPQQAPHRYASWLDQLASRPTLRGYASQDEVIARLQKNNPRLPRERATFLSSHWAAQQSDGQWQLLADGAHKLTSPLLYHVDDVTACWQRITAPVLWVEAADTDVWRWLGPKETARIEIDRRIAFIANVDTVMIEEAGHMVHHDQPAILAQHIERFLIS